jgi:hypothetical protein
VKINLMKPTPSIRRHYYWWISAVVLFHFLIIGGAIWLYFEQHKQIERIDKQLALLLPIEKETKEKVKQEEAFRRQYKVELEYKESVEKLQTEKIEWDRILRSLELALTPEARLFNLKADGQTLSGMAVFASEKNAGQFEQKMSKSVKNFRVDALEKASTIQEVRIKPPNALVMRFHFTVVPQNSRNNQEESR